jgi:hypothetical protein
VAAVFHILTTVDDFVSEHCRNRENSQMKITEIYYTERKMVSKHTNESYPFSYRIRLLEIMNVVEGHVVER